jgi:hypothetical protein
MGAAELVSCGSGDGSLTDRARFTRSRPATNSRRVALAYVGLWTITLLGAAIGTAVPALAPAGRPHPTLHGSLGDFTSIAATNARILSAPFLLAVFRFPAQRFTRRIGDLAIGGVLGANALRVGLALGRWHAGLLPYLPQLPLEWLAAALTAVSWLALRSGVRPRTALAYLGAVLGLVVAAAAVETLATPDTRVHARSTAGRAITPLHSSVPTHARKTWGGLPALGSCAGPGTRFKVASLPSPRCRSVPLGLLTGAAGLRQPPPDPAKEGPQ